jgi:hypothetical protein
MVTDRAVSFAEILEPDLSVSLAITVRVQLPGLLTVALPDFLQARALGYAKRLICLVNLTHFTSASSSELLYGAT